MSKFEKEFIKLVVEKLELKLLWGNESLCLNGLHFFLVDKTQRVLLSFFKTQFLVIFHHNLKWFPKNLFDDLCCWISINLCVTSNTKWLLKRFKLFWDVRLLTGQNCTLHKGETFIPRKFCSKSYFSVCHFMSLTINLL